MLVVVFRRLTQALNQLPDQIVVSNLNAVKCLLRLGSYLAVKVSWMTGSVLFA